MSTLPQEFIDRMKLQLGAEADAFFNALDTPSPTSIRLHHLKGKSPWDTNDPVVWNDSGYYLALRPFFHMDPHWHGGAYYVQEASSMILDYVLKKLLLKNEASIWIDLCAAPGGKTGILAKHLRPGDVLVANEVVSQRRSVLRENLIKGGYLNTFISGEAATAFHDPLADLILIDAPCAGEGMMRKDPEAIRQWSLSLVNSCMVMQQQIVHHAVKCLKPDGILIYSTCSYSHAENIDNISYFHQTYGLEPVPVVFPDHWHIQTIQKDNVTGYQLYPHRTRGEGLFIAVLQNTSSEEPSSYRAKKPLRLFEEVPEWLAPHLSSSMDLRVLKNHEAYPFIHKAAEQKAIEVLTMLPRAELIGQAGERKGKDFIPSHFLAMAGLSVRHEGIIDVELKVALDFLERSTSLPTGNNPGWYLIRYDGTILGWAKWTTQGWKNHYPMPWRLRDRKLK